MKTHRLTVMDSDRVTRPFSGSYLACDVEFLLTPVHLDPTPLELKERQIQNGSAHYSEMISLERRPDTGYLDLFEVACVSGVPRLAKELRSLTDQILHMIEDGRLSQRLTLCSLVRAGVPYGVLLRRSLARAGVNIVHFGISIIRDRGLDPVAMRHVLSERPADGVVFVDGWTGKGAIATELERSWRELAGREPTLAVIADPCGRAALYGSRDDWLIPSGILGGNISGLISRSILRADLIGPDDFHGCQRLDYLSSVDLSRDFVDRVDARLATLPHRNDAAKADASEGERFREQAEQTVSAVADRFGILNLNRIKPGIAEATRAILRRRPDKVLVRSIAEDPDLAALLHLCKRDKVPLQEAPDLTGPYRAITLIRETT